MGTIDRRGALPQLDLWSLEEEGTAEADRGGAEAFESPLVSLEAPE